MINEFTNEVSELAIEHVETFKKEVEEKSKSLEERYDEIVEKVKHAKKFWYRRRNKNPNRIKDYLSKRYVIKSIILDSDIEKPDFNKDRYIIVIRTFGKVLTEIRCHLRIKDYGRTWVVNKEEFLSYLQINK